jgi:hypothetical protein
MGCISKSLEIFMKKIMVINDEILIWDGRSVQIVKLSKLGPMLVRPFVHWFLFHIYMRNHLLLGPIVKLSKLGPIVKSYF